MAKRRRIPGISPNPMTNLIITDIVLRGVGRLTRRVAEKQLLKVRYNDKSADKVVKGRSVGRMLTSAVLARVATSSVPGALAVGGGLAAKTIFDRARGTEAKVEGRKQVRKQIRQGKSKD